jgi:hypothetical protein
MAAKIYYRERDTETFQQPRYQLVAVAGVEMKVYGDHLRMRELREIASGIGADLELLPKGPTHEEPEEEIEIVNK